MVTLRLISTLKQYNFITTLLQTVTDLLKQSNLLNKPDSQLIQDTEAQSKLMQYPFEIVILSVPKNYLRKLVGYQDKQLNYYRKKYNVDFDYNRDLLVDEVFAMNGSTSLRIFGKQADVIIVNELLQKGMGQLKMKTVLIQMVECKLIMENVKEIKLLVDPCEIRVKQIEREWKDLRHPFYYIPNYFREIALIGT